MGKFWNWLKKGHRIFLPGKSMFLNLADWRRWTIQLLLPPKKWIIFTLKTFHQYNLHLCKNYFNQFRFNLRKNYLRQYKFYLTCIGARVAHWWSRCFSPEGSWIRLPLYPSRRDLGQVLNSQLPVALQREIPEQYPCCGGSLWWLPDLLYIVYSSCIIYT